MTVRRSIVAFSLLFLGVTTHAARSDEQADERPNIVFVMTDDQGYWDTGVTGNPHIDTPNMNRIASEGVQLTRYYASPVCSLTRAGLMTGRYYLRTGLYNTRFGGDSLGLNEVTVAQLLNESGYRTGLFGKWHLGKYPEYQPQNRGFDEFLGHYHGHIERYEFPDQIHHNGRPVEARGYVTDLFTDASIDFIEDTVKRGEQPFFCALMYNAPHSPWLLDTSHFGQPDGDVLLVKYLDRGLPIREARIYALIERIDQNLERLLACLEELEIDENTLVVFTSDNGGVSRHWKGGMNGQKASPYEGGVRAPCFVRWPSTIPAGGTISGQTSHVDWLPTFCEIAGAQTPTDRTLDGKSFLRLLKEGRGVSHQRYVYHTWDRYFPNPDKRWGISSDRWKLVGLFGTNQEPDPERWRLYDLLEDPSESTNLITSYPEIAAALREEFERWFQDCTDGMNYAPIPVPIGNHEGQAIEISPSWATIEGANISYQFDGYDWDTIEGWKDAGERARWRINVQDPGVYRVELSYGCRPSQAGNIVRLSAGNAMVEHRVASSATSNQFARIEIGKLELANDVSELTIELMESSDTEALRLNSIRLIPTE